MKILLVSSIYAPGVGGSSRLLRDVVDHLVARGHHVEVLAFGAADGSERQFDREQAYPIHRIAPSRKPGWSSLTMQLKLLTLLGSRERYDLVLTGVAYPSAILARVGRALYGTPYAIYSHGEDVTCVESRTGARLLLESALRSAGLLMTNSSFTRERCLALGAAPDSAFCVHPGIDPSPYEGVKLEEVEALRERLGLQGKVVILTLARLMARKGHDTIVRALPKVCATIPDVHYLVVGHGDAEPLTRLAASLGVADRLSVVPYVHDHELPALFSLCDTYAMVSRWDPASHEVEGFGIVFLEAAACGRPTIAGNQGGSPDAVEHGVSGFVVDPQSVTAVETALTTLLSDPELAQRMGRAGRERVRRSFTKQDMLQKVERLLEETVARRSSRR